MDSLKRGFAFFKQSWQMASVDRDLLKPSIFAMLAGFIVSVIAILPMVLVGILFGDSAVGQVLLFILGTLLVFAQYTVGYIFSAMTIYLIYGYLSEGDGRMDKAWSIVRRDFWDIVSLAAASTVVNVLKRLVEGKGKNRGRSALAGLINTVWTEATYLVLPAMVIEDIHLKAGLSRATSIVRNNLLLVGVSTVGVKAVNGIIGFLLGATGIALGLGVGVGLVSLSGGTALGWAGGITLGVLISAAFILTATVASSYTATAYHTCLYLWAMEAERLGGAQPGIAAPAPLAAVLGDLHGRLATMRAARS